MKNLKTTLVLVALFITTAVFGQKTVNKTFSGVEDIRINIASGNVTVKKSSSNEVKVSLEYTYDKDDYEPTFDQTGKRLRIKEEFRNRRGNWNNRGRSEWTLEIPDGLTMDLNTGSGNIEVMNLKIELQANSGSGNLEVEKINGYSRLTTGSGNIYIETLDGNLKASTGSGNVRARGVKGDTDLSTGSGNIRVAGAEGSMDYKTGSGNIDASDVAITDHSRFNTGSGSIEVTLSAELSSDVSINTGSGNATLDFNGQKIGGMFTMEAKSKSSISAPFKFDKEYEEDGNSGWRGRSKRYIKEATIGSKDIRIDIMTGSGSARVRK